ncbi:Spy/CpxP family protein refolding chaperone [Pseudothauera nasutitermitis]|nr:periplasmic heavy metal sensor [Pseudothauera nasutitermitis]
MPSIISRRFPCWLAAALLAVSLQASAAPDAPPPGFAPPPSPAFIPGLRLPPGIELSEAQQDQLFDLHHAQAPRLRQLQREADAALRELRALGEAESFDATRARAAAERHGRALAALLLARTELDARSRAVLSPAQRQALEAERTEARPGPGAGPAHGAGADNHPPDGAPRRAPAPERRP